MKTMRKLLTALMMITMLLSFVPAMALAEEEEMTVEEISEPVNEQETVNEQEPVNEQQPVNEQETVNEQEAVNEQETVNEQEPMQQIQTLQLMEEGPAPEPPQMFTVSFDANGGSDAPAPQTVKAGSKLVYPNTPTRTGYDFYGWFKERECTNEFDLLKDVVTADMTLFAKWVQIYMVHYECNGGSPIEDYGYASNLPDTLPVPVREGYVFMGWYTDPQLTQKAVPHDPLTADTTLYAAWAVTVTFNVQGHGTAPASQTVIVGGLASKPADPSELRCIFDGWYTDAACTPGKEFDFSKPVYENTTLYAKWLFFSRISAKVSDTRYASMVGSTTELVYKGESVTFEAKITNNNYYIGRVLVDGSSVGGLHHDGNRYWFTYTNDNASRNHEITFVVYDSKGVPPTGDSFKPWLWGSLLVLSAAGIAAAVIFYKKKNK